MTLAEHLSSLRRYIPLILVMALLGIAGGAALALLPAPKYQASTFVTIGPRTLPNSGTMASLVQGLNDGTIAATLAGYVSSSDAQLKAATELGVDPATLSLDGVTANNAIIVEIRARAGDGQRAIAASKSGARTVSGIFSSVYPAYQLETLSTPTNATKIRTSPVATTVLGGAVGLFLGYVLALLLAAVRGRRRDVEAEEVTAQ